MDEIADPAGRPATQLSWGNIGDINALPGVHLIALEAVGLYQALFARPVAPGQGSKRLAALHSVEPPVGGWHTLRRGCGLWRCRQRGRRRGQRLGGHGRWRGGRSGRRGHNRRRRRGGDRGDNDSHHLLLLHPQDNGSQQRQAKQDGGEHAPDQGTQALKKTLRPAGILLRSLTSFRHLGLRRLLLAVTMVLHAVDRQDKAKRGTYALFAFHPEAAAMGLH